MRRLLAALLLPAAIVWAGSVTRIHFTRSGGLAGAAPVAGTVELRSKGSFVGSPNGYRRELSPEEVTALRQAVVQPAPPAARGADAYRYAIRIDRPGRRTRRLILTDTSGHPLAPWLQKEAGAIARRAREP